MAEPESNEIKCESVKPAVIIKEDWYQTEANIILVLLVKNVDASTFKIEFKESVVSLSFPFKDGVYEKDFNLSHKVIASDCTFKVYSTKVEVKLAKAEAVHWSKLEREVQKIEPKKVESRNWDRVVAEYEEEQPEGEAALNALFQKIYNEGSDEVKKAMNKSFLESGGTELNTNWDAVKKDKVSIKPPEGMEWKTWDK